MFGKVSDLNKTILSFGLSNLVVLSTNLLTGILIMKYISPNEFGLYNKFLIIANYVVILNFGIPILLQSELPGLLKIKATQKVTKLVDSAFSYFLLILIPSTCIALVLAIWFLIHQKYLLVFCCLILVTNIWQNLFQNKFLKVLYRTGNEFKNLIKFQNIGSVLSLVFSFLIIFWGIAAVFIRGFISTYYTIYKLIKESPLSFKISYANTREILKRGFQYFRVNIFFAYFPIFVSSLSAVIFDSNDFGLLSIYFLIITSLRKLVVSIDKVLYIKISESYFLEEKAENILKNVFENNVKPYMFTYLIIAALMFFIVDEIIQFFPFYKDGIHIIRLSLILGFLLMFNFQNIFFDVYKRMRLKFNSILFKYASFLLCIVGLKCANILTIEGVLLALLLAEVVSITYNYFVIKRKLGVM